MSTQDDLFTQVDNIYTKTKPPPIEITNQAFMVMRFLSMNAGAFWPTQLVNLMAWRLPPWAIGGVLYYTVPRAGRAPRPKYIKKGERKGKSYDPELIRRARQYFKCSSEHVTQTLTLLEAQGLNVKEIFGFQKGGDQ